ncbi:hypothetical protein Tco_0527471 [Tanacetum coccineum]
MGDLDTLDPQLQLGSGWLVHARLYATGAIVSCGSADKQSLLRAVDLTKGHCLPNGRRDTSRLTLFVGRLTVEDTCLLVLKKVGAVAYKLELPQELSRVHNTFHVSNLKKCYSDDPLVVPLEGLQVDDKLHFVEEPVEIMDREVKQLRRSRVPIVKVRWNSKRGPEFTWEREDQFRKKYPHLFTKTAPSSSAV